MSVTSDTLGSVLAQKRTSVWSVEPDTRVYEVISIMMDKRIGALVVLSHGRLVGIVSERDYARKVIPQGRSSKDPHGERNHDIACAHGIART